MRDFFRSIRVNVPNRSGEYKSFQHLLTLKCGTLVPIMWDEVIPGTKVYLKSAISASLPPLASDTFMRCKLKLEAFFVPFRQLSVGFSPWLTGEKLVDPGTGNETDALIPQASLVVNNAYTGAGSLADYLGFKVRTPSGSGVNRSVNIFPFLAYHWIYDQMYRNSKIQRKVFSAPINTNNISSSSTFGAFLPYISTNVNVVIGSHSANERLGDGLFLSDLRQRNFDADYFTNMTLNPQSVSTPASVDFQVDAQGNGSFTIAALRAQNSLQQYLERQNLAGFRLTEYVKANYGVNLSEGMAQMPLFLGRQSIDVYSKGIDATADTNPPSTQPNNPFTGTIGARYGSAYALGNDTLIEDFEAKEPGIIMVLCSLVPKATYASGIDPLLLHFIGQNSQGDVANALLQNVGQQAVRMEQLTDNLTVNNVFGYTDRFSEFMTKVDKVSGLLRDGFSLQSFALQRSFGAGQAQLNSAFLQIPTNYMDQVTAVSATVSNFGCWVDSFFEYKISHPLHKYSIPSLQDPAYEHGHGVLLDRSGQVIH